MKLIHALSALAAIFTLNSVVAQEAPTTEQVAMRIFLMVCVPSKGLVVNIENGAQRLRLTELSSADALRILDGKEGRVWATGDLNGQFMIASQSPNTCTVKVRGADEQRLRQEFESWLPPPSSPFVVNKEAAEKTGQSQVLSYSIAQSGRLVASWVLMTNQDTAAISVRANQ